jgi:hypothetical protein
MLPALVVMLVKSETPLLLVLMIFSVGMLVLPKPLLVLPMLLILCCSLTSGMTCYVVWFVCWLILYVLIDFPMRNLIKRGGLYP